MHLYFLLKNTCKGVKRSCKRCKKRCCGKSEKDKKKKKKKEKKRKEKKEKKKAKLHILQQKADQTMAQEGAGIVQSNTFVLPQLNSIAEASAKDEDEDDVPNTLGRAVIKNADEPGSPGLEA